MNRHANTSRSTPNTTTGADNWQRRGNCASVNPNVMFPGSLQEDIDAAKAVCKGCPVYRACLRDAIRAEGGQRADTREGVFAGLTGHERHLVYRTLKRRGQLT